MSAVPSEAVPLTVTSRSLPASAIVMVCSLGGEPVLYFDLALLIFQVPANGSAATRVAASPKRANASFAYRMMIPSFVLGLYRAGGGECPAFWRVLKGGKR